MHGKKSVNAEQASAQSRRTQRENGKAEMEIAQKARVRFFGCLASIGTRSREK